MTALHAVMASPIGELTLLADGGALAAVYMENHKRGPAPELLGPRVELDDDAVGSVDDDGAAAREVAAGREASAVAVLTRTRDQLAEYFAGDRREFDLPLAPAGNPFRQQVWALLQEIPYGETRTYGDLARQLGDRNLAQAVGSANARNPVSIIIPCHRVVGAAGALTGYAGGLDRKHFLLGLEDPRRIQDALF